MTSPVGLHRVREPNGVLPQAAERLDADPAVGPDEVRIAVEKLNLDAASFRQLFTKHGGDGAAVRDEVLDIVRNRGKMQNPVTGSGGMLIGTVEEVGPQSPLGLKPGDRVATLVSLTLTPLRITDDLARWDGASEQVPAAGHAILFGRSIAARIPDDLDPELALAVFDVCGAPALTERVVRRYAECTPGGSGKPSPASTPGGSGRPSPASTPGGSGEPSPASTPGGSGEPSPASTPGGSGEPSPASAPGGSGEPSPAPTVAVIGGAGKSGSLSLAAARRAGAGRTVGIVPNEAERERLADAGIADLVAMADARDPVALAAAVEGALGAKADVTVVCVDVPGCEHGAILSTADGGTVIFFSMATSFAAAALGAEGLAADVTMLIGNGYTPGHADLALDLIRTVPAVRKMFEQRLAAD